MARSKTRSSRKTRKPRRISFPRFSTLSFPFCTIPKTENSEMKTSECCFKPFYQTPSFSNSEFSILYYTQNGKLGDGKPRSLIKRRWRKLQGFHLRVFRFECSAKWKIRSWKTSEFDQSTSEFDETTSEQISEVFNSDFSVLGIVQNGKLGVENLGKLILRGFRELRVFDLAVVRSSVRSNLLKVQQFHYM